MKHFTICITICLLIACNNLQDETSKSETELIVFHAGSLTVPLKQLILEFTKKYPEINVLPEAAGSVTCARKITDLERDCDLFLSADYKVIDEYIVPEYADKSIRFATNEMVIVFNEKSRFSDSISNDNWQQILSRKDVFYGRSDPNADPCGYRAVLTMRLADSLYEPNFAEQLLQKDREFMRQKSTSLLALLAENVIDYAFEYKSVAIQHNLKYIELPDEINLSNSDFSDFYKKVQVEIAGKTPDEKFVITGESIIYGLCKIKNSPNPEAAKLFFDFLFSNKGKAIFEKNGQKLISEQKK